MAAKPNGLHEIQQAALDCLAFWRGLHDESSKFLHPESTVMVVSEKTIPSQQGTGYQLFNGTTFRFAQHMAMETDNDNGGGYQVLHVKHLLVGNQTSAIAQIKIGNALAGWMTLLKTSRSPSVGASSSSWQCIATVLSRQGPTGSSSSSSSSVAQNGMGQKHAILPTDFENVMKIVWDGYCAANRACHGQGMAKVFHSTCRLTFVTDDGETQIIDQEMFCQMVQDRYKNKALPNNTKSDNPHYLYRHLTERQDPRLDQATSLEAIEFATPSVAMVTVKIGHPPCLWTDYLTVANLQGQWWIVHKTSCHEPFLIPLLDANQ